LARIEELRSLGYDIEASPHNGYRLLNAPDVCTRTIVVAPRQTRIVGRTFVLPGNDFNQRHIEKLAHDGVKEAWWFRRIANEGQRTARTQMVSPRAKGFGSVLLRPNSARKPSRN